MMIQSDTPQGHDRPLLTFALFAYNQERLIAEAVQGALSQTYAPLEIILSDDCSPDHTFAIMQDMVMAYQGPHTIVLNRNPQNLGLVGHINHVMELARGELIVVAAGDDVSLPQRTERIFAEYESSCRKSKAFYSNAFLVDENMQIRGVIKASPPSAKLDLKFFAARFSPFAGATEAWHRDVFATFGPIPAQIFSYEDTIIPFMAVLIGGVSYIDEPLLYYRSPEGRFFDSKMKWQFSLYLKDQRTRQTARVNILKYRLDLLNLNHSNFSVINSDIAESRLITEKLLDISNNMKQFCHVDQREKWLMLPKLWKSNNPRICSFWWPLSLMFPSLWELRMKISFWLRSVRFRLSSSYSRK